MQPSADHHASDQPSSRHGTALSGRHGPADGTANVARVYDALLGGKDNYACDRAAAARLAAAVPGAPQAARDNRAFLGRAVRYLAGQGITQYIDIGSGLPAGGPVHHLAREHCPDPHVAYIDHDPIVVAHARALLADSPHITAIEADLRYPRSLLTMPEVRDAIDLSRPVGVLLVAVLHFLADSDRPHDLVQAITARLAPASYIALSHVTADHLTPDAATAAAAAYDGASAPGVTRTRDDIERFFDGLQIIPPGITDITTWRPGRGHGPRTVRPPLFYGGIGRIPPR
jgi:S-adenosyl methyltransferase